MTKQIYSIKKATPPLNAPFHERHVENERIPRSTWTWMFKYYANTLLHPKQGFSLCQNYWKAV